MSTKSKQRNIKRDNPTSKELQPGPYKFYIKQKSQASFEFSPTRTEGAFGKCRINRKPQVPETVPTQELTTSTV